MNEEDLVWFYKILPDSVTQWETPPEDTTLSNAQERFLMKYPNPDRVYMGCCVCGAWDNGPW